MRNELARENKCEEMKRPITHNNKVKGMYVVNFELLSSIA